MTRKASKNSASACIPDPRSGQTERSRKPVIPDGAVFAKRVAGETCLSINNARALFRRLGLSLKTKLRGGDIYCWTEPAPSSFSQDPKLEQLIAVIRRAILALDDEDSIFELEANLCSVVVELVNSLGRGAAEFDELVGKYERRLEKALEEDK